VRRIFAALRDNTFLTSVIHLTSGVAIANLLTFAALPVLTRLYSPEDFSVLAVFSGILSTLAVAACLRFDVAIPIPAEEDDALNVLALAILSACAAAALVAIATFAPAALWQALPRFAEVANFLWLLPIGLLLAGLYLASQMYYVRNREFRLLAATRVAQSGSAVGVQLLCGWLGFAPLGLLLGQVLNTGAGALLLLARVRKREKGWRERISVASLKQAVRQYRRFPTLSTAEALANASSIYLPVILIGILAAGPEAGYLILAMTIMQAPMSLIGGAVAQVYLSRGPEAHRRNELGRLTTDVLVGLMRGGVGPILFAGIAAPALIGPIFGTAWDRTGVLIAWMTPWFVLQFLTAPISMALLVTGHQGRALAIQIAGLLIRSLAVIAAAAVAHEFLSEAYALSGLAFYAIYLAIVMRTSGVSASELVKSRGILLVPAAWCLAGIAVAWIGSLIR
jgi:O-antigen/teichoic acid export membrane protein